jgi:hypothetical protein
VESAEPPQETTGSRRVAPIGLAVQDEQVAFLEARLLRGRGQRHQPQVCPLICAGRAASAAPSVLLRANP